MSAAAATTTPIDSSSKSFKRLSKEFLIYSKSTEDSTAPSSKVELINENISLWKLTLEGPKETPYEGGKFDLELKFPPEYPMKPPFVRFLTSIYHPNVSMKQQGAICQEIINKDWSPTLRVETITQRLYSMLISPHAETPLEAEIGELYTNNPTKFKETAKQWTKKYAL